MKTQYIYDGRGSVVQTVADEKTQSMAYTPFGEMLTGKHTGFGFNAEWYDAATGMQNLRARQYEPAMMRFSQKDIVRGHMLEPLSLNRYAYVLNDPVNLIDPSGHILAGIGNTLNLIGNVAGTVYNAVVPKPVQDVINNKIIKPIKEKIINPIVGTANKIVNAAKQEIENQQLLNFLNGGKGSLSPEGQDILNRLNNDLTNEKDPHKRAALIYAACIQMGQVEAAVRERNRGVPVYGYEDNDLSPIQLALELARRSGNGVVTPELVVVAQELSAMLKSKKEKEGYINPTEIEEVLSGIVRKVLHHSFFPGDIDNLDEAIFQVYFLSSGALWGLSLEERLSFFDLYRAKNGVLTEEELIRYGVAQFELELIERGAYVGMNVNDILHLDLQIRQAEFERGMALWILSITPRIMDAQNSQGGAVRYDGATGATAGNKAGPRDHEPFNYYTKNPDADKVMLGKYDGGGSTSYITQAGDDYTYFDMGKRFDEIQNAEGLTNQEMFDRYNKPFLDDAMRENKPFHFSHDPRASDGFLRQEFDYIEMNPDYIYDAINKIFRPR